MDYDIFVDPDAGRHVPKPFPNELREPLRIAFAQIVADPKQVGRPPCTRPHAPGGFVYEFHADVNGGRYYFAIFYEVDDTRKQVGVTFVSVRPPYDPNLGPRLPPVPSDDFIAIPPSEE